mgnify:CR=1 FL=1
MALAFEEAKALFRGMKPLIALCLAAGLMVAAEAKEPRAFVVVSSSVNPAAEAVAGGQPQTFAMYIGDFEEYGSVGPGGATPPEAEVINSAVQAALPAGQFVPVGAGQLPDVVIACHWGELSPDGPDSRFQAIPFGQMTRMDAMLMGLTRLRVHLSSSQREQLRIEGSRARYFLMVTAYDATALQAGREVIRWQTRMSADSLANPVETVWAALVDAGRPYFAKSLKRPELRWGTATADAIGSAGMAPKASEVISDADEHLAFKFL